MVAFAVLVGLVELGVLLGIRAKRETRGSAGVSEPGCAVAPGRGRAGILVAPGAADALTAPGDEDVGFEALYATGAGIADVGLGLPGVRLTAMTIADVNVRPVRLQRSGGRWRQR